ncbi:MAG: hypothetical protein V2B18_15840 [Pseudomonadota bacterium]
MSGIRIQPMNDMVNRLWTLTPRVSASSYEEAESWQKNPEIHYRRLMSVVRPLPRDMAGEVHEAIAVWEKCRARFLSGIDAEMTEVIHDALRLMEAVEKGEEWNELAPDYAASCASVVWNIEWIVAFAWQLPSADPNNTVRYREIAREMLAIMFIEFMSKPRFLGAPPAADEIRRFQALHSIMSEAS